MEHASASSSATTDTVSQKQSATVRLGENKESITLIWFDHNIGSRDEPEETAERLRQINDYVVFYNERKPCVTYIQSIAKEKIFLITSGSRASEILPSIGNLPQIDSIFIFCFKKTKYEHLLNEYSKIIGIYMELDELCASIEEQVDLVDKQLQAFSVYDQHQTATKDVSKQSAGFLRFQLFNDAILHLPCNKESRKQMIDVCRQYYRGNTKQWKLIDQFEHEYQPKDAIRWYLKQSFIYKMINKALRNEDIDQFLIFRFFIGDLLESLACEHQKIVQSGVETLTVYLGMNLLNGELEQLKENEGKLISTNRFLSTSRCRSRALLFATKRINRAGTIPVLAEITCNAQQLGGSVIFGDITEFSEFPEAEVLFNMNAAFQLESVQQEGQVWLIKMSASSDGRAAVQDYINETRRKTSEFSIAIMFGRLMCYVGQYDNAIKYFEHLRTDPNDEDPAWIKHHIGRALYFKRDWMTARKYYDLAYDRMMKAKPVRSKDSAQVLNNIGVILFKQIKYDEALDFHHRALAIREKFYASDHLHIAHSLQEIGYVYYEKYDYDRTLEYLEKSLRMKQKCLPSDHPDIAAILWILGRTHGNEGQYETSLQYLLNFLTVCVIALPPDDPQIAFRLSDIGFNYERRKQPKKALGYYKSALAIYDKSLPIGHVKRARTKLDILRLS